jgi:hypothetical protein
MKSAFAVAVVCLLFASQSLAEQFRVSSSSSCFTGMVGDKKLTTVKLDNAHVIAEALGVSADVANESWDVVLDGPTNRFAVVQKCDGAISSFLTTEEDCTLTGTAIGGLDLKVSCPYPLVNWAHADAHGHINCRFSEKAKGKGVTSISGSCLGAGVVDDMPCELKLRFGKRFEPSGMGCPK